MPIICLFTCIIQVGGRQTERQTEGDYWPSPKVLQVNFNIYYYNYSLSEVSAMTSIFPCIKLVLRYEAMHILLLQGLCDTGCITESCNKATQSPCGRVRLYDRTLWIQHFWHCCISRRVQNFPQEAQCSSGSNMFPYGSVDLEGGTCQWNHASSEITNQELRIQCNFSSNHSLTHTHTTFSHTPTTILPYTHTHYYSHSHISLCLTFTVIVFLTHGYLHSDVLFIYLTVAIILFQIYCLCAREISVVCIRVW